MTMGRRIYWNDGWKFNESYENEMREAVYQDDAWESVRLPHTCRETPFHYFDESSYQMECCYRKHFFAPMEWKDQTVIVTFEGIAHETQVFLNGEKMGEHHCGYTAFSIDISEKLQIGAENVLTVRVDSRENLNIPPFGYVIDYMTYGGIYREVYVDIKNKTYLADIFLHSEVPGNQMTKSNVPKSEDEGKLAEAKLISEIKIRNSRKIDEKKELFIRQSIRERGTEKYRQIGEGRLASDGKISFTVSGIKLWDLEIPVLYEVRTELLQNGNVLDENVTLFGFRTAVFLQDGFYLNDRKIKLCGLNRHQSYPYVGYAMPESMQKWDADVLKNELGVNAVRTSHYPQSQHFVERCDELGLLVFTEIPGWQHIGDENWKKQAVENVKDMVVQYRNHPSVILWGVRINESGDDDAFYRETNRVAHELDPTRQTGGVRAHKKSSLLEDVYTYNDFSHNGTNYGCEKKSAVTSDNSKPYLISEYNGHMYPTKSYDWEEHRVWHAMRHVNVLDAAAGEMNIAGSFGWCMFDYNTHKDFGSGDRICYHGVMDMFRNPKLAAAAYACQQEKKTVLEISSSMDIGEHPGCNRGTIWIFTNADSVRMYKNDRFLKEYTVSDSPYKNLAHGPVAVDDFIGDAIEKEEDFNPAQAKAVKYILNAAARYGLSDLPKGVYFAALKLILIYHMKPTDAVTMYNRYIGDWGGTSTSYRFDAVKNGKVVKTVRKEPVTSLHLSAKTDHQSLTERHTYDVAEIRIHALDQNDNIVNFYQEPVVLSAEGPIDIIGPKIISLQGGMGGTYVRTTGEEGVGILKIKAAQMQEKRICFEVKISGSK